MADIRIQGLTKQYGETTILDNLHLTIKNGEFLTLLGSSGCGKSTLLKLIAGLDQPTSGTVTVENQDFLSLSPSERNCAMVFQSYALYPHMSVRNNICMPLLMKKLSFIQRLPGMHFFSKRIREIKKEILIQAEEIAKTLGIDHLLLRKPYQLSGGQRQRVALARAMVRRPNLFLFDEPLSNLDANLRQSLRAEIRQLHDKLGVTFIYVTHDQHEAMSMSDRIAIMKNGKIIQLATPKEIYETPENIEIASFIGSPKINLLQAMSENGQIFFEQNYIATAEIFGPCTLGVRPNIASLTPVPHCFSVTGNVMSFEYTGTETLVTLQAPHQSNNIVLSLPPKYQHLTIGNDLTVYIPVEEIHVFDSFGVRRHFTCVKNKE